jgi:DNA-directed RNA polymerase specialized sigma24 family protein
MHAAGPSDAELTSVLNAAHRAAYRICGSRSEAEDLAQDAAVAALVRWHVIAGYAEAWAARVAINAALSAHRTRIRQGLKGYVASRSRVKTGAVTPRLAPGRRIASRSARRGVGVLEGPHRLLGPEPHDAACQTTLLWAAQCVSW